MPNAIVTENKKWANVKKNFFNFLMWAIFKVFIEFVTMLLLLLMFWFFGLKACGMLIPWPGIKPTPPGLEGKVLTTGLLVKSTKYLIINISGM